MAIGTALFESLNRSKHHLQDLTLPVSKALKNILSDGEKVSNEHDCNKEFEVFVQFVETIEKATVSDGIEWIQTYLEENLYNTTEFRLWHALYNRFTVSKQTICRSRIIQFRFESKDCPSVEKIGELFTSLLLIVTRESANCVQCSPLPEGILLCLYESAEKTFGVAYHRDDIEFDKAANPPQTGMKTFPFFYCLQKRVLSIAEQPADNTGQLTEKSYSKRSSLTKEQLLKDIIGTMAQFFASRERFKR